MILEPLAQLARPWEEDPQVEHVRRRLIATLEEAERESWQDRPWGFALIRRREPQLSTLVLGVVTATETCFLTPRMLGQLLSLRIEGSQNRVLLECPYQRKELLDEPSMGILMIMLNVGEIELKTRTAVGASALPKDGIVFAADSSHPAPGWPR